MMRGGLYNSKTIQHVILCGVVASGYHVAPLFGAVGEQLLKLEPEDDAIRPSFGVSVAIEEDIAVIGAFSDGRRGRGPGSAYLFDVARGEQVGKLSSTDGTLGRSFGYSVSTNGASALVGAFTADNNGENTGAAYLFDVASRKQLAKLIPPVGQGIDFFGVSVAVTDTFAVVGAPGQIGGEDPALAFLYDASTGNELAVLHPDDTSNEQFGWNVDAYGNTAIVGTNGGSAYLIDLPSGRQRFKLEPEQSDEFSLFGASVAISGQYALEASAKTLRTFLT